jgi:hypothetical protein
MAQKKPGYRWGYALDRRIKPEVPDDLKREVQANADDLVAEVLTPKYIKPPPKKPRWNYPIELWTKWHRSFFYFGSIWANPVPTGSSPPSIVALLAWITLVIENSTWPTFGTHVSGGRRATG